MGIKCLFERCKFLIIVNFILENILFYWYLLYKVCINIKVKKMIEEIKGSWVVILLYVISYSL